MYTHTNPLTSLCVVHYSRIYWFQGEVGVAWTGGRWQQVLSHSPVKLMEEGEKEEEEEEEEEEEGGKGEKEEGVHWMIW